MKITINELDARAIERAAQKRALEARAVNLGKKEAELQAQAQAAAEAGNVEAYKKVKASLTDLEVELLVTKTQLSKLGSGEAVITEEEAAEAWEDFRSTKYEEEFSSLSADFEVKKAEMLAAYKALIDLQADGCKTREKLAGYRGINSRGEIPLDRLFPMSCLPVKAEGHETLHLNGTLITKGDPLFYIASLAEEKKLIGIDYVQNETIGTVKAILWQHSSKPF